MKIFNANISEKVSSFLYEYLKNITSHKVANKEILNDFGIEKFFDNDSEIDILKLTISQINKSLTEEPDRAEYGDFQTNANLANKVILLLTSKNISPEIIIEPTCGKGNFIIASLNNFSDITNIYGFEIYKPYIWETKFNILEYYFNNHKVNKPKIVINHCNIFDYNIKYFSNQLSARDVLIIGNPPWVTNSKLSSLSSSNLPPKSNFKNQSGLDAMTGKGNFDIAESITTIFLDSFQNHNGHLALLIKNSVIKNIIFDQKVKQYQISDLESYCIDSKEEFNASVNASLLFCKLNSEPSMECKEFDFYNREKKLDFGWFNSKFVSNIAKYKNTYQIDGVCPFEWRQGIKHDCSSVMELEKANGHYINNLSEEIILEEDLVYGLLKSSDLNNTVIKKTRKHIIVTQSKIGEETSYIQEKYPATYNYLEKNISRFQARKSIIYKGKPPYSIFGIGDYSFRPYKIAISGLYRRFHFTLVLPQSNKPVMLDDTCYFIGFDRIEYAVYAIILLNSKITKEFLQSLAFLDAKRVFTKDILMRIDILKLACIVSNNEIEEQMLILNNKYDLKIDLSNWGNFLDDLKLIQWRMLK